MTLSPLDDYPVTSPEVMRHVGTSDRNFYDRYYFNLPPVTGELMLIVGPRPVPEPGRDRRLRAAATATSSTGGAGLTRARRPRWTPRSARCGVEVLEGLKRLRSSLEPTSTAWPPTSPGRASIPPLEPSQFIRTRARVMFDTQRLAQTGSWSGTLDGRTARPRRRPPTVVGHP